MPRRRFKPKRRSVSWKLKGMRDVIIYFSILRLKNEEKSDMWIMYHECCRKLQESLVENFEGKHHLEYQD
jgi:hypothetical protein